MESKFILSCCSTSDLNAEYYLKREISTICFHYYLNDECLIDDFGKTMPISKFYKAMEDGLMTKTSQISVGEYVEYFEKLLATGKDVLHIDFSSGLSGSYNSAMLAKSMIEAKYQNKLYIVDSLAASSGYGLLVDKICDLRGEGKGVEECRLYTEDHKLELNHWFFSTDLKYYVRGGRVSKVSGFIGNALHICPLLNVNYEGKLIVREKVRGKKNVIKAIVNKMIENAENGKDYDGKCFISNSACLDDAKAVAELVEENFPKLKGKVQIFDIGTTIGSHTGPGTVALFFFGKKRMN